MSIDYHIANSTLGDLSTHDRPIVVAKCHITIRRLRRWPLATVAGPHRAPVNARPPLYGCHTYSGVVPPLCRPRCSPRVNLTSRYSVRTDRRPSALPIDPYMCVSPTYIGGCYVA
jgi:hypothetical protein